MRMYLVAVSGLAICICAGAHAGPGSWSATGNASGTVLAGPAVAKGTVTSIDKDAKTFVVTTEKDEEITITYDDKTVWVLDGQISTCEAVLKEDHEVTVRHSSGAAARVEAKPKKA